MGKIQSFLDKTGRYAAVPSRSRSDPLTCPWRVRARVCIRSVGDGANRPLGSLKIRSARAVFRR